jgi:hypothetical protein
LTKKINFIIKIFLFRTQKGLKKVFNEIHDQAMIVDLCLFCFGGRQRKFYLADNAGQIR